MEAIEKISPINGVQIHTYGQLVKLTKGQRILLNTLTKCVQSNAPLNWDLIVDCYCKGVRADYPIKKYVAGGVVKLADGSEARYSGHNAHVGRTTIRDEYEKDTFVWRYTLRGLIRSWFVATLGILVIKNQLIIIPVIQAD